MKNGDFDQVGALPPHTRRRELADDVLHQTERVIGDQSSRLSDWSDDELVASSEVEVARGRVTLAVRLAQAETVIQLQLSTQLGVPRIIGRVADISDEYLSVTSTGTNWLVQLSAIQTVAGLSKVTTSVELPANTRSLFRSLANRSATVYLVSDGALLAQILTVGKDHVDVQLSASHEELAIPFAAIAAVRT